MYDNIPDKMKGIQLHFPTFGTNKKFSYFIYTDFECAYRAVYSMNFTHLDSIHFLLNVKEQGRGHF